MRNFLTVSMAAIFLLGAEERTAPIAEVRIRDPFVFPFAEGGEYLMTGTTSWDGFLAYRSVDLERWRGPTALLQGGPELRGARDFWAPEIDAASPRRPVRTTRTSATFAVNPPPHRFRSRSAISIASRTRGSDSDARAAWRSAA